MSRLGAIGGRLYRGEVSFDFVGRKKLWYAISGLILVISIFALAFRGLNYSVDFKGGDLFIFKASGTTNTQISAGSEGRRRRRRLDRDPARPWQQGQVAGADRQARLR